MKEIYGTVYDKNNEPLEKSLVVLLNNKFEIEYSDETNSEGKFNLSAEAKHYPFFIAVKEYKENYLEYWSQNIDLHKDLEINPKVDVLEIYGLHCFQVKGAGNYLMVYFRPMSLTKFKANEKNIVPDIGKESLTVSVNGEFCEILTLSLVEEQFPDAPMTSFLIQISTDGVKFSDKNKLELEAVNTNSIYYHSKINKAAEHHIKFIKTSEYFPKSLKT